MLNAHVKAESWRAKQIHEPSLANRSCLPSFRKLTNLVTFLSGISCSSCCCCSCCCSCCCRRVWQEIRGEKMQLLLRHDFFKDMLAALCALKLSFFARLAKRACRSGDEVEVSFPRFGVRGYSESGLVPVRRPSWHTPPHTCLL